MSIAVKWDNSKQTIIRYEFSGKWSQKEFDTAIKQAVTIAEAVKYTVDFILDFTNTSDLLNGMLIHLKRLVLALPENQGKYIIVGKTKKVQTLAKMFTDINKSMRGRLIVVDNLENAHKMIAELQTDLTTVLVIEDEHELREEITDVLEFEGYCVLQASDGKTGLTLAQDALPNLIICDISMPEMDGYSVLIYLRQQEATASIPFIFLTARTDRLFMRHGMELGADDYLTKPFTHNELLAAVRARFVRNAASKTHAEVQAISEK